MTLIYVKRMFREWVAMDPGIADKRLSAPDNWHFGNIDNVVALQPDKVILSARQAEGF